VRRQLISDLEICRRYRDGEPLFTIAKRSGLWTSELQLVLVRNGQDVRTPAEINALKGRKRHVGTLRLKDDA
jgi:hypothetical protein